MNAKSLLTLLLLLAPALQAQEMYVHVYRQGGALAEDPILRAAPLQAWVDIYDAFTGERVESHELQVFSHVYANNEVFWPKQLENLHRKYMSIAWVADEQAWILLGLRDEPMRGDWQRIDVDAESRIFLDVGKAITGVDRSDPGEATLRRETIAQELLSRVASASLEDVFSVASLYKSQAGLTGGERYLVLRTWGWALFMHGDQQGIERARVFYQQAIVLKPGFGSGYYNLGLVEQRLGNIDAAIGCLLAAHRATPSHKYLRKLKEVAEKAPRTENLDEAAMIELQALIRDLDAETPSFTAIDERFPALRYRP